MSPRASARIGLRLRLASSLALNSAASSAEADALGVAAGRVIWGSLTVEQAESARAAPPSSANVRSVMPLCPARRDPAIDLGLEHGHRQRSGVQHLIVEF